MTEPTKLSDADIEKADKKDLLQALQDVASLSFLQAQKLSGSISTVAKKASKDKIVAAYNECFEKKLFSSPEQREADRLAQELERKARLESAQGGETSPAAPAEVVDEGPKKYKIVVSKKGDKTTYPKKGDKVKVNYHGTVDGKIFDSSVDKDWLKTQKRKAEPIVFKVGAGLVIRGWDEALMEMSVGEKSTVTIEPEWAYGRKGKPEAGIGPNATLTFDMELVAIL
uniref:peptidylprolyl isomerase n=1 Tax=Cryptomonas curvata TaxID=233186 RepID=A0A7S0ML52_9CRYP|mmetsp:Transcript_43929/g.91979  ORF Transcript_43929/g.91979 Transcript_43929/m.91979 type:complete len:227 (+) Transcript_43929:30-710(+)